MFTRCCLVPTPAPTDVAGFAWHGKPGVANAGINPMTHEPDAHEPKKKIILIDVIALKQH